MKEKKRVVKTKSKSKLKFDLGLFLLVTGALSNVTIWIGAFVATETQGPVSVWVRNFFLPILGGISGLAMGITVTVGLVFVLTKLAGMKPTIERKVRGKEKYTSRRNIRYYGAWGAIILLVAISPALLAPYVYMTISGQASLFSVLGDTWSAVWSVGRIVAADLAMGAVALVHGVQLGALASATPATRTAKSATGSETPAKRSAKSAKKGAKELRVCDVEGCEMKYAWPQGKGAHLKKHHPDLIVPKGIALKDLMKAEEQKVER